MKKTELKTNELKKLLNAHRLNTQWHNKNKSGGNFGLNIYFGATFERDRDKQITGYYNKEGDLYGIKYGSMYGIGQKIPKCILKDIKLLSEYLLNLNAGGDWLTFIKNKGLLEELRQDEGV